MPASAFATDATGFTIDRTAHALRFVRDFAAPPQAVFTAWTTPESVSLWWDAGGEPLSKCEIDLRVGGSFVFVSPSHAHMAFAGTYQRIEPPHLIEFDAMGALGRVMLADHDGGTRMTVEIVCRSDEHLDEYIKLGVANGTSQTLDNLVAHLA
ncbi:MAG: SRPBCC domain-containing protein [Sphingomonas sp.]|uniref:SRPBCC domain-containing protein n=1 Tax=Sphingomonas sp. TaxID=28214 RepID=UPI003F800E99